MKKGILGQLTAAARLAALVAVAAGLSGCLTAKANLTVTGDAELAFNDRGGRTTIDAGQYEIGLSVAKSSKDESEISFPALKKTFKLHLPDAKVFLDVTTPLELSPESLGQPFALEVTRVTDLKKDHYAVRFLSPDGQALLATGVFNLKSDAVDYDAQSKTFLESFQKVRHSQRGTVITIMSRVSPVVDHLGQIYIAPWIYSRYSSVEWIVSHDSYTVDGREKWKKVIDASPVVDLFLFNHEGDDYRQMEATVDLGWKKHQIRFLYTEGCDSASSSYFETFLSKYNAVVAVGHRATSASPFVAFPLVRFWTYGSSVLAATKAGWSVGGFEGGLIDYLSFTSMSHSLWTGHGDMLRSTEPGIGWTPEMTPDKVFIDQSALVERDTDAKRTWFVSFATTFGKDVRSGQLDNDSLFDTNATPVPYGY